MAIFSNIETYQLIFFLLVYSKMYHASSTFEDILHDYFDSPNILNRYFEEDDEMLILVMMTHINNTRRYFYVSSQRINMDLYHQRLMLDGTFKNHY